MYSVLVLHSIFVIHLATCCVLNDFSKYSPCLECRVISTDLAYFQNTSDISLDNGPFILKIELSANETYDIAIQFKNTEVMDWRTDFHVYRENTEDRIDIRKQNFEVVKGFIISQENSSSVLGYIKDTQFYGTIAFGNTIYYIEDLKQHPEMYNKYKNSKYNAVIYNENTSNIFSGPSDYKETKQIFNNYVNFINANDEMEVFKSIIGKGKVCTLFILLDNSFLRRVHNDDIKSATIHILNSVESANSLFRSTDFDDDGFPDNIGFLIKYFVILQSEKSPMNLLPLYKGNPIEGSSYIKMFSRYKLLNEVCLGVAFTGHTFKNDVLGISYTAEPADKMDLKFFLGGICDRPHKYQAGKNLNTLAISPVLKTGIVVPQYIFDLSLSHEIGHSFGSDHDYSQECKGYLMSPLTPRDNQRQRFIFSRCSKRSILKTIISRGHCFENYEDPFCGNGIVETGEDCDCGTTRDCEHFDVCCVPQGRDNSCKVNKHLGYDCHPSQGICCTPICTYKDLSDFDLDCHHFTEVCPCQRNSRLCSCGVNGMCIGNICHSNECTRISLKECDCPLDVTNNKCRTCCIYNNVCYPASVLTAKMVQKDETLIMKLKRLEQERTSHYGSYTTFTQSDYNVSVKLFFREVNLNDYCLLFGKVGICDRNYKCLAPNIKQIYPNLRTGGGSSKIYVRKTLMILNIFEVYIWYHVCN